MTTLNRLIETYVNEPQIGLVLGAGVTVGCPVPGYAALARRVFELAADRHLLGDMAQGTQLQLPEDSDEGGPSPAEILTYVRAGVRDDRAFRELIKGALYENIETRSQRMVAAPTYRNNTTLDAVISFCAARPGAAHANPTTSVRAATNRRVGAILTTNYDNLTEGAFGSKYGKRHLLRPYGRFPISHERGAIPVFHCHGYVSYVPASDRSHVSVSPLLATEKDYFAASYDQLSFGNIVASNVLRRMPCLFIGSAMTDRNIRRMLFQIQTEDAGGERKIKREHYAILPQTGASDRLSDAVLSSYGVSVIRIERFEKIVGILHELYVAPSDVDEAEWVWTRPPDTQDVSDLAS